MNASQPRRVATVFLPRKATLGESHEGEGDEKEGELEPVGRVHIENTTTAWPGLRKRETF